MAKKMLDTEKMMSDFDIPVNAQKTDKVTEIRRQRRKEARDKMHASVYFSTDEYARLSEMAKAEERPMSYIIRDALRLRYESNYKQK